MLKNHQNVKKFALPNKIWHYIFSIPLRYKGLKVSTNDNKKHSASKDFMQDYGDEYQHNDYRDGRNGRNNKNGQNYDDYEYSGVRLKWNAY